ncbi:MAG: O-antigen ligase family protein [Candidatus Kryptoniota bacterium]
MLYSILPYAAIVAVGLWALIWIFNKTDRWVPVAILSHLLLFLQSAKGIDLLDILFSIIFFGGLIIWFVRKFAKGESVIRDGDDLILVLFLIYAFSGILLASAYGFSFFKGFREFLLFVPYLLYMPIREYIKGKKQVDVVIWSLIIVMVVVGTADIVKYKLNMTMAQYFWQIISGREAAFESLFMSGVIILATFYAAKQYNRVVVAVALGLTVVSLAITFSRGYWIGAVIGVGFLMIFSPEGARKRLVVLSSLSLLVSAAIVYILFPKIFTDILQGLIARMAATGFKDISLQNRFAESSAVLSRVSESPIVGYGLGSFFSFYNLIFQQTSTTWYIHNVYLFMMFKFGAVGTVLFIVFYFRKIFEATRVAINHTSLFERVIMTGFISVMLVMLIISFTSPQFYDRAAVLILSVFWGVIDSYKGKLDV